MRLFIFRSVVALAVIAGCCLGSARAAPPSLQAPQKARGAQPASEGTQKARYPALAYTVAGIITLIMVTIVAFPSRKETWDQQVEKWRRRDGK